MALITVTSQSFVLGTLVMLHSFRRHNPWFGGDILVLHHRLPGSSRRLLEKATGARLVPVSRELQAQVGELVLARPELNDRKARFYSLELFRWTRYERLFFCDSDLLFLDSIEPVLDHTGPLLCAGDGAYYRGLPRDPVTYSPLAGGSLKNTFNSGFMVVDPSQFEPSTYQAALGLLRPDTWSGVEQPHTDQLVLNRLLQGKQTLVGCEFNYLLLHAQTISAHSGISWLQARVLHYNTPVKPWSSSALWRGLASPRFLHCWARWQRSFLDASTHLQALRVRPHDSSSRGDSGQNRNPATTTFPEANLSEL